MQWFCMLPYFLACDYRVSKNGLPCSPYFLYLFFGENWAILFDNLNLTVILLCLGGIGVIKSITATTREIDDENAAIADILGALDLEHNLLAHSVGIISCFSEFEETGVLQAICDALPFTCIGATTCVCAAGQDVDQLMLAITVITSDTCRFSTVGIEIGENYVESIQTDLSAFWEQSDEKPALMLSYLPLMNAISGDMMIAEIDKVTGGIPLFGTSAVDHKMDYSSAQTIYQGKTYREAAVFCAIYGNPNFTVEIASLNEKKIRTQKAIITESDGNILIGVNGKSALEYLEEIGLTKEELATGLGIIPLIVDHKDGTKPVARAVFALTPEGYAVCGGAMPVNATLGIGRVDMDDVLLTTKETMDTLLQEEGVILSYSCMARYLALGAHNTAEAEEMRTLAGERPYLFACSGGEVCPLPDANGKFRNFYHNYTIVFCRLS